MSIFQEMEKEVEKKRRGEEVREVKVFKVMSRCKMQ